MHSGNRMKENQLLKLHLGGWVEPLEMAQVFIYSSWTPYMCKHKILLS